jgi:hypothetical protein
MAPKRQRMQLNGQQNQLFRFCIEIVQRAVANRFIARQWQTEIDRQEERWFLKGPGIDWLGMLSPCHYKGTCGHVRDPEGGGVPAIMRHNENVYTPAQRRLTLESPSKAQDRLCGLEVRVPGY